MDGCDVCVQLVIPGVMGLVLYDPSLNRHAVSPRAKSFCLNLIRTYRVNIFDQLVYEDRDIAVSSKEVEEDEDADAQLRRTALSFELCVAAGTGDLETVS